MPYGFWVAPLLDVDVRLESRIANRPHRGKRTKVKAARKANRRNGRSA